MSAAGKQYAGIAVISGYRGKRGLCRRSSARGRQKLSRPTLSAIPKRQH